MNKRSDAPQTALEAERCPLSVSIPLSFKDKTSRALLRRFREGCDDAFSQIHARFRKPIQRYVSIRISDDETAEEITQEVFLKAFRFRESYEEEFAFSTWLWTIARNTVFDWLRKSKDTELLADYSDSPLPDEFPCPGKNAESLFATKDKRKALLRFARSLTRTQRRVLWMRIVHQLSYEEIAHKLGLSLAAVKNLIYRARLSLSAEFGQQLSFT